MKTNLQNTVNVVANISSILTNGVNTVKALQAQPGAEPVGGNEKYTKIFYQNKINSFDFFFFFFQQLNR